MIGELIPQVILPKNSFMNFIHGNNIFEMNYNTKVKQG